MYAHNSPLSAFVKYIAESTSQYNVEMSMLVNKCEILEIIYIVWTVNHLTQIQKVQNSSSKTYLYIDNIHLKWSLIAYVVLESR